MADLIANLQAAAGAGVAKKQYVAALQDATPYILTYPWDDSTGFGTKYSNPATLPTGAAMWAVRWSPNGEQLFFFQTASPYIGGYPWSDSGFGTKYSNPSTLPSGRPTFNTGLAISPNSASLIHTSGGANIEAYAISSAGFGSKYTNLSSGGTCYGVAFSPSGNAIAVSSGTFPSGYPFVKAYEWSDSTGFGSQYSDPATVPANNAECYGCAFSPNGDAVAFTSALSPYLFVYPWDDSTGFGTKYSNPATLPSSSTYGIDFSPAGDAIVVGSSSAGATAMVGYPFDASTGIGTKYANPSTAPSYAYQVQFTKSGGAIISNDPFTPAINAYAWSSSSGFGSKFSNPGTTVTAECRAICTGEL